MPERTVRVYYMEDRRWRWRDFVNDDRGAEAFLVSRELRGDRSAYSVLSVPGESAATREGGRR